MLILLSSIMTAPPRTYYSQPPANHPSTFVQSFQPHESDTEGEPFLIVILGQLTGGGFALQGFRRSLPFIEPVPPLLTQQRRRLTFQPVVHEIWKDLCRAASGSTATLGWLPRLLPGGLSFE